MRLTILFAAGLALTLSACGWLPKQSEFERVGDGRPLEVPPDLDEPDTSSGMRVPNATYSAVRGGFVEETEAPAGTPRARLIDHEGNQALAVAGSLDATWRRVGIALDRTGLDVEDSDQASSLYRIVYVDREARAQRPGRFSRWFLRRKGPTDHSGTYQLRLRPLDEGEVLIQLFDAGGAPAPAAVNDRVLGRLRNSLS